MALESDQTGNADKSSAFKVLAILLAATILAAAALLYLRSNDAADGDARLPAIAVISQSIPLHAREAAAGNASAFDRLGADIDRLVELRAEIPSLATPGDADTWDSLTENATAVRDRRADVVAVMTASSIVDEQMPRIMSASEALVDLSGATAAIQEFQRRGAAIDTALPEGVLSVARGAAEGAASDVAQRLSDDLAYMRSVLAAMAGEESELDVAALDASVIAETLDPLRAELAVIEPDVNAVIEAAPQLDSLARSLPALSAASSQLAGALTTTSDAPAGGLLDNPLLPIALLTLGLLLLGALAWLHSRSNVFERAAREQSAQNERNQQAILRLLDELGSLADGDLTVEATVTEDITGAIADSINYAIEKLRELVATINETAIMVDSAAKQTESTAAHMARASETQTQEISAATESIVSMAGSIEEVSGNAERSSDVARHSVDVAHKGGDAVRRTIDGMNAIRETIQDTSKRIKRLGESSQEIGNIVELINDIAEQTNILALNASIQASMAGEAGRGFAVVADEVQRLAERSTNATRQIEVLVRTIQADTNEAVVSMERSTTDVVGGALLAENAGAALDEIEQVSNQIASLVQNISGSARQQAGSAADVTRRTTKLKEISDQSGRATRATAAAISKLSELASQLRQTVAGFTLPSELFQASALSAPADGAPGSDSNAETGSASQPTQEKRAG